MSEKRENHADSNPNRTSDDSDPEEAESRLGQSAGTSGVSERRDDNPFSFKHFLRNNDKGARPKVYCAGKSIASVSDLEFAPEMKQTRVEYSAALPDFVQDHLVVEQCYLGGPNAVLDLPDCTPSRDSINVNRFNSSQTNQRCGDSNLFLDLPGRPPTNFPLDLPQGVMPGRTCAASEVGVSKSLPDFLADGAAMTQSPSSEHEQSTESPDRESQRLRRELEAVRAQLGEQISRVELLNRELDIARNREHDYTQNLAKALEQVEENLERSNMRTASAENTIVKLRHEIKSLSVEVNTLKLENRMLRGEEGAAGGHEYFNTPDLQTQRLAQDLKAAASSAEHSLRQLLSGVDNLRIMAASLENVHRVEEKSDSFMNFDDDSGPAL